MSAVALLLTATLLHACGGPEGSAATQAAPAAAEDAPPDATQDVAAFWSAFRAAVQSADAARVRALTHIPLEVRGALDDEEPMMIGGEEFLARWPELAASDPGLGEEPGTMTGLIARTEVLDGSLLRSPTDARVGNFVFRRTDAGWRLVAAYLDR